MIPIPPFIAEVYEELKTEITWLHGRWTIYRQLFGQSEKRIDMLNECADAFFFILQDVLLGEVQVASGSVLPRNLPLVPAQSRVVGG